MHRRVILQGEGLTMNTPSKRLNIILFSSKCDYAKEYRELLSNFNVRVIEIENEKFCQVILESIKSNGILVDISAYMRSSPQTRELLASLEKIYPTARIRYNKDICSAELIILNEKKQITLRDFLENRCRPFHARRLRMNNRMAINLNARLFWEQDGKEEEFFCTTSNISQNGLFLVDEVNELPTGTKVKIQLLELSRDSYIYGTITRSIRWGERFFQAPGFGVHIDSMDDEVLDDYMELAKVSKLI
jgi:hypothetical protein